MAAGDRIRCGISVRGSGRGPKRVYLRAENVWSFHVEGRRREEMKDLGNQGSERVANPLSHLVSFQFDLFLPALRAPDCPARRHTGSLSAGSVPHAWSAPAHPGDTHGRNVYEAPRSSVVPGMERGSTSFTTSENCRQLHNSGQHVDALKSGCRLLQFYF